MTGVMDDGVELVVRVTSAEDEREEVAGLARRLRAELLDLDVESIEPLSEETVPEGAKGLSGLAGALAVRLGVVALGKVVARVRDWASRNDRTVEVTIDGDTVKITGATLQQQEQLVNVWLARHAPGA